MSLEHKLAKWQDAGVIDAATRERIEAFERQGQRPILLYALGGLGALTLGIGVISVVASNWDAITKVQKLGLDLALGVALAGALYFVASRGRVWQSDVLAGVYYAFVLASIALLGQVYQLGAPEWQALLTWSLCTAPFMLLVRSRLLGAVWLCGLVTTHAYCMEAWIEAIDRHRPALDHFASNLAVSVLAVSIMVFVMAARIPWLVRERPQVSAAWTSTLWSALFCGAFMLGFVWYERSPDAGAISWSILVAAIVVLALHLSLPRLYPGLPSRARLGVSLVLTSSWIVFATGVLFEHGHLDAVGAVYQVLLLALCAWTALQLGRLRTFNALTGLIALRVLVMYFEVFGSMLSTGLGMITGGVLTLLLAWLWKRKSPELATRLAVPGGSHAA
ncbi:MAG TPA: DUF2157 domain-containing protein [Polyangiales bacterium]|nr:DUF2157 domain-containing protein [Polyangiales bacterium]